MISNLRARPGTSSGTKEPSYSTVPGFTNRNGQTVIRPTNLPGTDYNQRIYVLECGNCGHQYGSNGSDNFQRRCPCCDRGRPGLDFGEEPIVGSEVALAAPNMTQLAGMRREIAELRKDVSSVCELLARMEGILDMIWTGMQSTADPPARAREN